MKRRGWEFVPTTLLQLENNGERGGNDRTASSAALKRKTDLRRGSCREKQRTKMLICCSDLNVFASLFISWDWFRSGAGWGKQQRMKKEMKNWQEKKNKQEKRAEKQKCSGRTKVWIKNREGWWGAINEKFLNLFLYYSVGSQRLDWDLRSTQPHWIIDHCSPAWTHTHTHTHTHSFHYIKALFFRQACVFVCLQAAGPCT